MLLKGKGHSVQYVKPNTKVKQQKTENHKRAAILTAETISKTEYKDLLKKTR